MVAMQMDPISLALTPPPGETQEQRELRLRLEAEAKQRSDSIDEQIRRDRDALRRQNVLKMLLLGQSGSGKSTTLKNIQLIQCPEVFHAERKSWRSVIQLNLVRSVNTIVDAISATEAPRFYEAASMAHSTSTHTDYSDEFDYIPPLSPRAASSVYLPLQLSDWHTTLKLRLRPLRQVEADLRKLLGDASDEVTEASLHGDDSELLATPFDSPGPRRPREFCVRSHQAWKASVQSSSRSASSRPGTAVAGNATDMIAAFRDDIQMLWNDETVHEVLRRRRVTLEDSAEYYLSQVSRIANRYYEPTDDDVVRARLRTIGVQEYRIPFKRANSLGSEWWIYDMGGARTMRQKWLQHFDDVNAVLFLAPISCFDEKLAEDRRVNRLKDSVVLWKSIVGSKLLTKSTIILFLNKYDLLKQKIQSGVMINKYIPRYGNRENSAEVFGHYIRDKFRDYMHEYSPAKNRPFYGYLTSVVNTSETAITLHSIRDGILHNNLKAAALLSI